VEIRRGRKEEAAALEDVFTRAARAGWSTFLPRAWFDGFDASRAKLLEALTREDGAEVLVAERDGTIEGFTVIRPSQDPDAAPGVGELHMAFTDPGVWGAGVGRALLEATTELLRAAGFREATLWTAEANERPRRVYESAGWVPDGATRERTIRGATWPELRYRRGLG